MYCTNVQHVYVTNLYTLYVTHLQRSDVLQTYNVYEIYKHANLQIPDYLFTILHTYTLYTLRLYVTCELHITNLQTLWSP